jgi:hypothetical protein
MEMAISFWLQVTVGLLLLYIFPAYIGKELRRLFSTCFAYGLSILLAAGASFLFTLIMFGVTDSSGRGFGGLIFLFVLGAQAVVAVVGGLMILGAMISHIAKKLTKADNQDIHTPPPSSGGGEE